MKNLYRILTITLWAFVGTFIGRSLYQCYDYYTHPGLYAMQSAPWYSSIQISAVFTLLVAAVLLLVMWMIRRKRK
jgi:hypothetical protein